MARFIIADRDTARRRFLPQLEALFVQVLLLARDTLIFSSASTGYASIGHR